MLSQERIYDERYRHSSYDERSAVRVLSAEMMALRNAVRRATEVNPDHPVSVLDFGYGTGRVTNEFLLSCVGQYGSDLVVVAYDVSKVGLRKAADELAKHGFEGGELLRWQTDSDAGRIIGSVHRKVHRVAITVTFVHGDESEDPDQVQRLLHQANNNQQYLLTTSWYSALGHIFGSDLRRSFFTMLSDLTLPTGEFIVAVAATGDLQDAQELSAKLLAEGAVGDLPIETYGDVVYDTEMGQQNYWHVFSTDLVELADTICGAGQVTWIEAIRMPDNEFQTVDAEQGNYARVKAFNREKVGSVWSLDDFRAVHTVAAIRSAHPDGLPVDGYSAGEMAMHHRS